MTLIIGGLCAGAFAQTPTLSLPALPSLPQAASNSSSLPSINLPSVPVAPSPTSSVQTFNLPKVPSAPAAPSLASPGVTAPAVTKTTTEVVAPANTAADKPPLDPEGAMADTGNSKVSDAGALPPQGMPNLPLPNAIAMPSASIQPPSIPLPSISMAATALPEINAVSKKPKIATWQTKLAPSIIPPKTNFNYKREVLPESIYATQYDRDNSHLPKRVTREDYQAMLFSVVAKNDINGTRALLNAGTGLDVTNSYGETPLQVAKRSGARDVAELLVARGAK